MVEHLESGESWKGSSRASQFLKSLGSLQKFVLDCARRYETKGSRKDGARLDKVIAVIIARLDHAVDGCFLLGSFATPTMEESRRENEIIHC